MEKHDQIMHSLGSIEVKVDTLCDRDKDHEKRLRGLEKARNVAAGILAFAVTAAGWVFRGNAT